MEGILCMCGIAAIFAYHAEAPCVDEAELLAIRDRMQSRGPDGAGRWINETRRAGLAHRRLSIIDLSASGAQPMHFAERRLSVAFNGEIYNYRELRRGLEQRGHHFQSNSDTEVLLHLYAERGEAMTDELRGMYAFALWDGTRRGLFLARDPYGIKPLYLADDGKTLRAASQIKALVAGGGVNIAPEPAGHVGFFLWGSVPEPFTLYCGIRALPAGSSLWIGQDGNRCQKCFCSIPQLLAEAESATASTSAGAASVHEPLRRALVDSVRHHLVADVPVGVFLSSGRDSATLASLAAEQEGELRTVTLGFAEYRGTANDETPLAEAVARQLGAQHQTIWVSRSEFASHLGRLFAAMDRPSTDGVNAYFVSLATARTGLKVALSGLGGDELLGGYPGFAQIPRTVGMLGWLGAPNAFGRIWRAVTTPFVRSMTSPKYAGLLEYGGSYAGAYLLRRGMFMPWELPEILDADLVKAGWSELQPLVRLEELCAGIKQPWLKVACLETCGYLRNQLLNDADWAGMAHSLEIRVPLVDVPLLKSVAPSLASAHRPTKQDMALTAQPRLPAELLARPKTGFQIPVREWLMNASQESDERSSRWSRRGLRGWAREVYSRFT